MSRIIVLTDTSKCSARTDKKDLNNIKNEVQKINVILENEIRSDIKLLADNYLPSAA